MNILLDGRGCAGSVRDCCTALEDCGVHTVLFGFLKPGLYHETSEEFEDEQAAQNAEDVAGKILDAASLSDLVVTRDLALAKKAAPQVLAVLHPNGFVYNPKSMNLLSYAEYIKEVNSPGAEPLKKRRPDLDRLFASVLAGFTQPVAEL